MATVSKLGEGTSFTTEAEQAAPTGRSTKESAVVPKVSAIGSTEVPKHTAEAKGKAAEERDREETAGPPKIFTVLPPKTVDRWSCSRSLFRWRTRRCGASPWNPSAPGKDQKVIHP